VNASRAVLTFPRRVFAAVIAVLDKSAPLMPMPDPLRETRYAAIIVAAVAIVVGVWRLVAAHSRAALTLPISKVHQD
jgi:hypothetical protein